MKAPFYRHSPDKWLVATLTRDGRFETGNPAELAKATGISRERIVTKINEKLRWPERRIGVGGMKGTERWEILDAYRRQKPILLPGEAEYRKEMAEKHKEYMKEYMRQYKRRFSRKDMDISANPDEADATPKPVKAEGGRYLLRTGKNPRRCWMCAFYYRERLCNKYGGLCGTDGIFLDTGARVEEATE